MSHLIIAFIGGLFIGFMFGVLIAGVCNAAARGDELAGTK